MTTYPAVAVVNSSDDTTEMIRVCLQQHGFTAVVMAHVPEIKRGTTDFLEFIDTHDPRIFVWDVSIPYEQNWRFARMLMELESMKDRVVIFTTTNKRALESLVGPTDAIEIIGKPYDLEQVMRSVERAAHALGYPAPTSGS
jgi:DNA-binding response OmpR family regulator